MCGNFAILSKREIAKKQPNSKRHCFDIIFAWEDILAEGLNVSIKCRGKVENIFDIISRQANEKYGFSFISLFRLFDMFRGGNVLMFDASAKHQDGIYNDRKYIPCIVDFWDTDREYESFVYAYRNNRAVLVSNRDVYQWLLSKKCPFKIFHFPLSIPDSLISDEEIEKDYDVIVAGRENPLLLEYLQRVEEEIPQIRILRRKYRDGHFYYYDSLNPNKELLADKYEDYLMLLRRTRIALYSTPGMDGTRNNANGWNQVTPRFLEELSARCHVVARYPENNDTLWYGMNEICDCVKDYNDFKTKIEYGMHNEVDWNKYKSYLLRHTTSKRIDILKEIVRELS